MRQAEALYQQFRAKKEVLQGKTKEQVMDKYGSAAKAPDEEVLALAQSENYVEYNSQGRVIKGEAGIRRSRYQEDVLINNHTSVRPCSSAVIWQLLGGPRRHVELSAQGRCMAHHQQHNALGYSRNANLRLCSTA